MPQDKPWPEFGDLLEVLAEHNVQGVTIANLRKDHPTALKSPEWLGDYQALPCVAPSNGG